MSRPKGDGRGRLGGRVKGTPNKVTAEVRQALAPLLEKYINGDGIGNSKRKLESDLEVMEPEDRARTITNLVPYVLPKLSSIEVKEDTKAKDFKDELDEIEDS